MQETGVVDASTRPNILNSQQYTRKCAQDGGHS